MTEQAARPDTHQTACPITGRLPMLPGCRECPHYGGPLTPGWIKCNHRRGERDEPNNPARRARRQRKETHP